ncbi:MAG: UbiA prenyltransferase family protein [Sedimentibacter saalensis]|uniref:UbiA prenyltransferase family protein n=1 Tax=Sedimentibacter saalensis TaxID=130788 RepID=UPI002B1FCF78|nr:UbiA prenyltransferase family protein [Sedimentibacter saalensis]MEA5093477.1 UbiA prenyltransferase family protein [Sedimentibacter saalensis]
MRNYIKLLRPKHYIKNFLIFVPAFFSKNLFSSENLLPLIFGFISFSMSASVIYIINDIRDVEKDKLHAIKCKRPIASGKITVKNAYKLASFVFFVAIFSNYVATLEFNFYSFIILLIYVLINFSYSLGLKNIPVLDIVILASGYVLRVLYGAAISQVIVSNWLYLTVISFSLYLGLGKRRNEFNKDALIQTRKVLEFYNYEYLDKNMYLCLTLGLTFYSLWTINATTTSNSMLIWTVPIVLIICLKYNLNIEEYSSDGDPVNVLLSDKVLMFLIGTYLITIFIMVYGFQFMMFNII